MNGQQNKIHMQEETESKERVNLLLQREQFDRNSAWLQNHISEIYTQHRGRCICVAGQELFVAENATDAIAQATAAHPEDKGWFTRYIPLEKASRIYAV